MGAFLKRLLESEFMPHGACWQWEPWVVWTNVIADSLPSAQGSQLAPVGEVSPPPPAPVTEGALVLVVDDEDAMRSVVVRALAHAGFRTLEARDGLEAVQVFLAHQGEVRVVLMDLTMPNMDGEEACRELQRRGAAVPVILSSGFNETEA